MRLILFLVLLALSLPVSAQTRFMRVANTIEEMVSPANNPLQIHTNIFVADTNRGGLFTALPASGVLTNNVDSYLSLNNANFYFKRQYQGPPNPRWAGARGDGVTDDSFAFQETLSLSNSIAVTDGIYLVGDLDFTNIVNGIIITGQSWKTILKRKTSASRVMVLQDCNGFSLSNIAIDNNGADAFAGITSYDSSNISINRVHFFDSASTVTATGSDRFAFVGSTQDPATHAPPENISITDCLIEDLEIVVTHVKGFTVTGCSFHRPMITCAVGWAPSNNGCVFEEVNVSRNYFYDARDQGAAGRTRTAFYVVVETTGPHNNRIKNVSFDHNIIDVSTNSYQGGMIQFGNFSGIASTNCVFDGINVRNNTLLIRPTATTTGPNGIIFFVNSPATDWNFTNVVVSGNYGVFNNKLTDSAFNFRNLLDSRIQGNSSVGATNAFGVGGTIGFESTVFAHNIAIDTTGIAFNLLSAGNGNNSIYGNLVLGTAPASRYTTTLLTSDYLARELWEFPKLTLTTGAVVTASNYLANGIPYMSGTELVSAVTNLTYNVATRRLGLNESAPSRIIEARSATNDTAFLRLNTSETDTTNALSGIELLENNVIRWTIVNSANGGDQLEFRNSTNGAVLALGQTDMPADLEVLTWVAANSRAEWVPGGGAGATNAYNLVEDETVPLTQRTTINFEGAGVTATDSGGKTLVTIPGGGGTTINTTDTFFPYRLNGTTFADSPLARVTASQVNDAYRAADSIGPNFVLMKQGRTGSATNSPGIGSELGVFGFGGWNGISDIWTRSLTGVATEDWLPSGVGHELQFWNVPNGNSTPALRLVIGNDGTSTFGGTVTTPLIDANASDVETYSQHGITNIVAGAADFTALGPSVVVWTNSVNTTIDIIDLQTAANRGQPFTFTTKGNGTATVAFTCATHTIDWRGPQITTPGTNEWVDYDFYRAGALLFGYANANGFETGLGITNINGVVSNNIVAGSNISITAGGSGQLTIASTGGGSGSVTNISSGNITNLFTVGIADPTSNPAITFTRVDPGAHRITMFDNTDDQFVQAVIGGGLAYDPATDTLSATGVVNTNGLAAFQIVGSGADFNFAANNIYEPVVYGAGSPSFTLTNAGTYQIFVALQPFNNVAASQHAYYVTNLTDSVAGPVTSVSIVPAGSYPLVIPFLVTTTGANRSFEVWGSTSAGAPTAGNLSAGSAVQVIYLGNPSGGGAGDFVGPAVAVDNTVVLFDGTTGKLGKQSTSAIGFGNSSAASLVVTANLSGATDPAVTYANALVTVSTALNAGAMTSSGNINAGNASHLGWSAGRPKLFATNDYTIQMLGSTVTNFSDLIFGLANTSGVILRGTNGVFRLLTGDGTATAPLADAIVTSSLQLPNGAAPTTDAFGEIAGDNDAWAASRGAPQWFDGTANVYLIGALASDTPTNGQVPTWNTGGTIDWQTPSAGGGSAPTNTLVSLSTPATDRGIWVSAGTDGTNAVASTATISTNSTVLTVPGEIVTANEPHKFSQTWNNSGVVFTGVEIRVTNTAANATSKPIEIFAGAGGTTSVLALAQNGALTVGNAVTAGSNIQVPTASSFVVSGRNRLNSTADGTTLLQNNASTGFGRLQLGPDDASPDAFVTIIPASGVGTTIPGGGIIVAGGAGTGGAAGGSYQTKTSITNAVATTQHTTWATREYVYAGDKELTESAATGVFTITLAAFKWQSVSVFASTHADDNTDSVLTTDEFNISLNSKTTVITSAFSAITTSTIPTVGGATLTTAWTITDNGNNTWTLNNNAVCSLTQVRLKTGWRIKINSDDLSLVTPL